MSTIWKERVGLVELPMRALPANFRPLQNPSAHARLTGPCGDTMAFWIAAEGEQILEVTYTTDGCENSVLCGSAAALLGTGSDLADLKAMGEEDLLALLPQLPPEETHCARLAMKTLHGALEVYEHQLQLKAQQAARLNHTTGRTGGHESKEGGIKHKIVVLSGKGGVGKSTVAVNLAYALAAKGKRVGLLDVDIHGPSVPTMLGVTEQRAVGYQEGIHPLQHGDLKVMSVGFFLGDPDDAIIWRGPRKNALIKQFVEDVRWGDLDYLIVDTPPGTGDEPLSVCKILNGIDGAVVVTTSQEVAQADVRKSLNFCQLLEIPVAGIVENMSSFPCPHCGEKLQLFNEGHVEQLAERFGVPFLTRLNFDQELSVASDRGVPFLSAHPNSPLKKQFEKLVAPLLALE